MANIVRPDILQTVTVLLMRVKEPNETNWQHLVRMIKYINGTKKKYLNLSADDSKVVE